MGEPRNIVIPDVQAEHKLEVSFAAEPVQFVIHASAGPGGILSPSGDVLVDQGASATFVAVPDPGFKVDQVLLDGAPYSG